MFSEPSKTGLIVLGAQSFAHYPDAGRAAFHHGAIEVASYFRSARYGLGLSEANTLDLFDSHETSQQQNLRISEFISSRSFGDIFVYLVGHGVRRHSDLNLALWASTPDDVSSAMNVMELFVRIRVASHARVYAIVDTCDSGVLHVESSQMPIDPETLAYLSNMDGAKVPPEGLAILTSNSAKAVGTVLAIEGVDGISAPIFTHELLCLLKEGIPEAQSFGFSMSGLRKELEPRIAATLDRLEKAGKIKRAEKAALLLRSVPHVTDQPVFEPNPTRLLSSVAVFPNNDARHALVARAAKQIRYAHELEQKQFAEIRKLETEVARLRPFEDEVAHLKGEVGRLKGEAATQIRHAHEVDQRQLAEIRILEGEVARLRPLEGEVTLLKGETESLRLQFKGVSTQRTIFAALFAILFGALVLGLLGTGAALLLSGKVIAQ